MTQPRRNLIRAPRPDPANSAQANRQKQTIQAKIAHAQETVERWFKRLNRAAKTIDKHHKQIARLQRKLRELESG